MKRVLIAIVTLAMVGVGVHAFAEGKSDGETSKSGGSAHGMAGPMSPEGVTGSGHMPGRMMDSGMMAGSGMMGSGMMAESMMGGGPPGERPLITLALRQRETLGLSEDQVKALEQTRSAFEREAIRRRADVEIAEREVADLLREPRVDLAKVEAKVRQIAGLQADLRLTRIKSIEKGKAVLTADQLKKLMSEAGTHEGSMTSRGAEEMRRFMNSERAPQAMASMMEMARQMGDGDTMLGMVRMMEMMGSMGNMMGPTTGTPTPQGQSGSGH